MIGIKDFVIFDSINHIQDVMFLYLII